MSTYLEKCQKLRKLVGISGSGPAAVTEQSGMNEKITIWIADADEWIIRKWEDWSFMLESKKIISAIAGTSTYTLSDLSLTDHGRWRRGSFARNPGTGSVQKLTQILNYDDYLKSDEYLGEAQTGPIEKVIVRPSDDAVIFWPTPTADTTVWAAYYKKVTRLAADTSVSPIPERFDSATLNRAKMFYAEFLEDTSLYASAEKDFERDMLRLESKHAPSFDGNYMSNNDIDEDIVVE